MGVRSPFGSLKNHYRRVSTADKPTDNHYPHNPDKSVGVSLASKRLKKNGTTATCGFQEEIEWYKIVSETDPLITEPSRQGEGNAALKLSFSIDNDSKSMLDQVCSLNRYTNPFTSGSAGLEV
jgi:hypothetical protein